MLDAPGAGGGFSLPPENQTQPPHPRRLEVLVGQRINMFDTIRKALPITRCHRKE
ncbi:hypothetical protein BGZ63DRAFT_378408 [Mariannaea sp. PMI_226]|nr:hypothetical protein BGZ63DRAFT_378408 [Mariannaea sp. PMI_226]